MLAVERLLADALLGYGEFEVVDSDYVDGRAYFHILEKLGRVLAPKPYAAVACRAADEAVVRPSQKPVHAVRAVARDRHPVRHRGAVLAAECGDRLRMHLVTARRRTVSSLAGRNRVFEHDEPVEVERVEPLRGEVDDDARDFGLGSLRGGSGCGDERERGQRGERHAYDKRR